MSKIKLKNTLLIVFITIVFLLLYSFFVKSLYFQRLDSWVKLNRGFFLLLLFLWKVVATVWPPLTGGLATLGAIPFIGWELAYLTDFSGSIAAGIIDYYLGRKYGVWILNKLFDEEVVEKIKKVKVKKAREIEAVFVYRVLFGSTIVEGIYYGAGVLGVSFKNFLIAAVFSHLTVGVPTFYLVRNILETRNIVLSVVSLLIAIPIFIKFRNRYFE